MPDERNINEDTSSYNLRVQDESYMNTINQISH